MLKLELLLRRIRGFDAKRMMVYVRDVKKETKTPTPVIMADMLYCILRYNVGFYDYHIFGFAHIHGAKAHGTPPLLLVRLVRIGLQERKVLLRGPGGHFIAITAPAIGQKIVYPLD